MPPKTEHNKEEVRNQILDAASDLFIEKGYDNATVRAIAKKAGFTAALIYFYFKNKEGLFYALQERAFLAFNKAIWEAGSATENPVERMTKMGRAYIRFGLEKPSYYDLMFIMREPMCGLPKEHDWHEGEKAFHLLKDTVRACMELGALPHRDPEGMALMIWASMHGLVSLNIRGRMTMFDTADLDFLIRDAFNAFDQIMLSSFRLNTK
ncbi:MAG: TetR/AcrR family transcriptional regulator [Bacteroidota bacterium]